MLETVIFGALCVLGLYISMGEKMILEWFGNTMERMSNNWILRPLRPALYECPICMASIWGTVVWLTLGNPINAQWSLYVFAVAGFNYIVTSIMDNE